MTASQLQSAKLYLLYGPTNVFFSCKENRVSFQKMGGFTCWLYFSLSFV
jgi:hypothetical protein